VREKRAMGKRKKGEKVNKKGRIDEAKNYDENGKISAKGTELPRLRITEKVRKYLFFGGEGGGMVFGLCSNTYKPPQILLENSFFAFASWSALGHLPAVIKQIISTLNTPLPPPVGSSG
jgi:hypothetical protein